MLSDIVKFKEYLNANSLKHTEERINIAQAVIQLNDTFTVEELTEKVNEMGWPVSTATIYRSIPLLIESGMINPIATHQLNNHQFKRCRDRNFKKSSDCVKCRHYIDKDDEHIKVRVILLENQDMVRSLIKDLLNEKGIEVFAFNDPSEFNNECKCYDDPNMVCADILITDIKMPFINGVDFIQKQINKNCRIKNIAFISSYWNDEFLDYAASIGAAVFNKPFSCSELIAWIRERSFKIEKERLLGNQFIKEDSA